MTIPGLSRRAFLAVAASCVGGARARAQSAGSRTRLVLLGTAGGPTPKVSRAAPAQAVVVGDRIYLVDCGDGVARQLALAKLPVSQLRAVFITHQHSDHNAGYGPLFLLGWTAGLARPVDAYGPPPLAAMTRHLFDAYKFDIDLRIADEGRPPLVPLVRPHEITAGGRIFEDDRVRVTAALNEHPPIAAEMPHAAANVGTAPFDVVTIALKPDRTRGGTQPVSAAPPGITRALVLDNADARVARARFAPGSREPVHSHPFDMALVVMAPSRIELLLGEEKSVKDYAAGDVLFLPRDVPHAVASADQQPFELMSVGVK